MFTPHDFVIDPTFSMPRLMHKRKERDIIDLMQGNLTS